MKYLPSRCSDCVITDPAALVLDSSNFKFGYNNDASPLHAGILVGVRGKCVGKRTKTVVSRSKLLQPPINVVVCAKAEHYNLRKLKLGLWLDNNVIIEK